jgi:hypothetical protein
VASFLVAAFKKGRFCRMNHFLTRAAPLLRLPALTAVLAAAPHAPPLVGEEEGEEEEEEEKEGDEVEEGEGEDGKATLKTCFFRLEPNTASLWEVTAWLRRGARGRGLAALMQLEVRCDELGALDLSSEGGGGEEVAEAVARLLGAAMALPGLETLTVAWALPAGDETEEAEEEIRDTAWRVLRRGPPPPPGHYLDAVLMHMGGAADPNPHGPPRRLGLLTVACRLPGALPGVMATGQPNHFHYRIIENLGWRPLYVGDLMVYHCLRLAEPAPWPEQGVMEADDFHAYDVTHHAP